MRSTRSSFSRHPGGERESEREVIEFNVVAARSTCGRSRDVPRETWVNGGSPSCGVMRWGAEKEIERMEKQLEAWRRPKQPQFFEVFAQNRLNDGLIDQWCHAAYQLRECV